MASVRTTIHDVARLANVSVATVSAVINRKGVVSEKLTRRVRHAIEALNYSPDHVARSLRVQRTHVMGMVMPQIASPFFAEILRGAEDLAAQRGYSIMICISRENIEEEKRHLSALISRRADGILLATQSNRFNYHELLPRNFPLVLFDRIPAGYSGTAVMTFNSEASYEATKHLIGFAHRRIGVITGPEGISTSDERMAGFRRAMSEAGLAINQEYVKCGDFKMQGGRERGRELLNLPNPPTAIFSHNYEMTLGLLRAVADAGFRCPKQVSVLGFDDFVVGMDGFSWATMFSPKPTCIAQPSYEIGLKAVELLLKKIEGGSGGNEEETVVRLRAELRIRESVGPPPA